MRSCLMALGLSIGLVTSAAAQSALDGPLPAPGNTASKPPHHAKAKRVRHAAKTGVPAEDATPTAVPAAAPAQSTPDDPLSLGMKWNGSNDTAAQTRWQNLNGSAPGSGAEVGLKLHF